MRMSVLSILEQARALALAAPDLIAVPVESLNARLAGERYPVTLNACFRPNDIVGIEDPEAPAAYRGQPALVVSVGEDSAVVVPDYAVSADGDRSPINVPIGKLRLLSFGGAVSPWKPGDSAPIDGSQFLARVDDEKLGHVLVVLSFRAPGEWSVGLPCTNCGQSVFSGKVLSWAPIPAE